MDFEADGHPLILVQGRYIAVSDYSAFATLYRYTGTAIQPVQTVNSWWGSTSLQEENGQTVIRVSSFYSPSHSWDYVPVDLLCKPCPKLYQKVTYGWQDGQLELLRVERSRKAYSIYQNYGSEEPLSDEAIALHAQGEALLAAGDAAGAFPLLKRAVGHAHDYVDAWSDLSLAYALLEQWEESGNAAETAALMNPWHAYAQYNLGIAYLKLNQPKAAEFPLLVATALQEGRWEPHYALRQSYEGQGNLPKALTEFQRALELLPPEEAHRKGEIESAMWRLR